MIVCATGYEISFPFFDADDTELHPDAEHRFPLFKRIVKPGLDTCSSPVWPSPHRRSSTSPSSSRS